MMKNKLTQIIIQIIQHIPHILIITLMQSSGICFIMKNKLTQIIIQIILYQLLKLIDRSKIILSLESHLGLDFYRILGSIYKKKYCKDKDITMVTKKTALGHVLTTLGYEDDEKVIVKQAIGILRRIRTITKESLKEADGMNAGIIDKMIAVCDWYLVWSGSNTKALSGEKT